MNLQSPESTTQFEGRKRDHIRLSMDAQNEATGLAGLDQVQLVHEALPDLNFSEIKLNSESLGLPLQTPFLVSSMTAGHMDSVDLNRRLALLCERRGWLMGVGSQRKQLTDSDSGLEWEEIRKVAPSVNLLGNIGIAQAIEFKSSSVQALADSLGASAMIIHLNPLQECLQPEGTTNFKGGLEAIQRLAEDLSCPLILKETGCGFSAATIERLKGSGIKALDVSGLGGTHWGRIEGMRAPEGDHRRLMAQTFANWGISTLQSLLDGARVSPDFELWASGGVRSGRDAACLVAMGARIVGFAKPILAAALESESCLNDCMERIENEFKISLFCTGAENPERLREIKAWQWQSR